MLAIYKTHKTEMEEGNGKDLGADYQGVDATLGRRRKTLFIPPDLPRPPPPPLPPPLKTTRVLGQAGGRLVVPNTGISLLVPRGGIAEDTSWEMYTIINLEDSRESDAGVFGRTKFGAQLIEGQLCRHTCLCLGQMC
ncbi:netrin receptor UNC5D-like [Gadus macrocephalus]|uniref:netrin receptor UNC5D-like n=1 Tax=Gadus macrocephalus TaxID=80720 RepID=UPI0028CB5357|nr:netrin receptor UNC5D-like [Gadus macrocephalus]